MPAPTGRINRPAALPDTSTTTPTSRAPAGMCRTPATASRVNRTSAVAQGRGLLAAAEGGLVAIADGGAVQRFGPSGAHLGDVVRHVAARPGFGTAYVLDRRGTDAVVI